MGTKITALPQVTSPTGTDELAISQDNGLGGRTTYKTTLDQVKNYVKNTGGGTGSVTSVGVNSTDESISVFGSPVVGAGTITLNISSVGLDKLKSGGATAGQVLTYNGSTSTWVASAVPKELPQTALSGQVLTYNGSTSTWVASSSMGVNITLGTAVTLTNQTSVDFTGIPSTAKRVTISLVGVSTNGTSIPKVQLGSGTIQTSGYKGGVWEGQGTATNFSTGIDLSNVSETVTDVRHVVIPFVNVTGNIWACSFSGFYESSFFILGGGSVTLSGVLDRIRLTTANGTDQFDAGTVNIMWE